jgi:hypothetical protein
MGESIWCDIDIAVPLDWGTDTPPWFVTTAASALCNGLEPRAELLADRAIWTIDGEGNYGLEDSDLATVLEWLQAHRVPYTGHDETKYDFVGTLVVFDGNDAGATIDRSCNDAGAATVTLTQVEELGSYDAVLDHLRVPDITTVPLDHLIGTSCPDDGDLT